MWQRVFGMQAAAEEIVDPEPIPVPTSFRDVEVVRPPGAAVTELTAEQREAFALALHQRWHGDHRLGDHTATVRCARLSGAFDDLAAIEPLILDLLKASG